MRTNNQISTDRGGGGRAGAPPGRLRQRRATLRIQAPTRTTTTTRPTETASATPPDENGGRTEGDGTLNLGAILPQSGNLALLGPPMIQGGQMAIADINEAGGVIGKDVTIVVKDDGGGGDDDLAATSTDELINNEKVDAILGAAASRHHQGDHRPGHVVGHRRSARRPTPAATSPPGRTRACTSVPRRRTTCRRRPWPRSSPMTATRTWRSSPRTPTTAPASSSSSIRPSPTTVRRSSRTSPTRPTAPSFDAEVEKIVGSEPDAVVLDRLPGGRRQGPRRDDQAGRRPG